MSLIDKDIQQYLEIHSEGESALLKELRRETHLQVLLPQMLTDPVQGLLLANWSKLVKPRRILEVGTFTGYSCLRLAEGLQPDGEIVTIEIDPQRESRILKYVDQAGLTDRVKLLIGNALEIIPQQTGLFELAFLDADKAHYCDYFDLIFPLMAPDGWIIADNVLWQGKVLGDIASKENVGLKAFNEKVQSDPRVEVMMLCMRDGLSMIRKRKPEEIIPLS